MILTNRYVEYNIVKEDEYMSRRETAIELIHSNRCMINSCLAKEELKQFNGDFAEYIIRQLSILRNQDKKAEEAKKSASM